MNNVFYTDFLNRVLIKKQFANTEFIPYAKQRGTSYSTRVKKLTKKSSYYNKKYSLNLNFSKKCPKTSIHSKFIYITYLEILSFVYKELETNSLKLNNPVTILNNMQYAKPNTTKTTTYTNDIGISINYAKKITPNIFEEINISNNKNVTKIYKYIENLIYIFSPLFYTYTLFTLFNNAINYPNKIPVYIIDSPLIYLNLMSNILRNQNNKKLKISHIIPSVYFKPLKIFYTKKQTMLGLASFINSKKRSKKYLRIMHKRLGLYTQKKPKWK